MGHGGLIPLDQLQARIRACDRCAAHLPQGPRPVFRIHPAARLLVVGQAPGIRVHESGIVVSYESLLTSGLL